MQSFEYVCTLHLTKQKKIKNKKPTYYVCGKNFDVMIIPNQGGGCY
jgi:hypothetical protein